MRKWTFIAAAGVVLALLGALALRVWTPATAPEPDAAEEDVAQDVPEEEDADAGANAPEDEEDGDGDGRFHRLPEPTEVELLDAIGYLSGSTGGYAGVGVVVHHEGAWEGLNLYSSGHAPVAILMDMDGNELHRWETTLATLYPGRAAPAGNRTKNFLRRVHLLDDGGLLGLIGGYGIFRLDRTGEVVWANPALAHHDALVRESEVWTLTRVNHVLARIHPRPIAEDFIVRMDLATGEVLQRWSVLEALEASPWKDWVPHERGDLFHTNALEILDGRLEAKDPAFRAGNVLISLRTLNALMVVDLDAGRVIWSRQGSFRAQHDPRTLDSDNGRILVFDNLGARGTDASRVLEIDPLDAKEHVRVIGTEQRPFFSGTCGTAVRLPGGNLLVTETDRGRAFELDPEGAIVWDFRNPARAGEDGEFVASLFEVERIPRDAPGIVALGL